MKPVYIHDKTELEAFLLKHRELNFYTLGDLDDFFWPYATWYAFKEEEIRAVILFYMGLDLPVVLAINNENENYMRDLGTDIIPLLPQRFYAHLSPGLEEVFQQDYNLSHHGAHYKMALSDVVKLEQFDTTGVQSLTTADISELQALYAASYPENWFAPRMLETGKYLSIRSEHNQLVCVAGVHVYSSVYRIAAIGNITTHPDFRNQGLGTLATAALCKNLLQSVDVIGLNVRSDNIAAIKVYQKLGFDILATYNEFMLESA